ncbi:hypothetical protein [Aureimonas psammosilenae]|uniref:hypothetical protein n=1 Tax=Aureimonas psammosilenae TaxID=2495496 RepID=UPI001260CC6B|nr:hypothetical protein [Aureimonas psammosilenae]
MTEADRLYVEEFATESADLMRRALAYAAQKRAEERAKALGIPLKDGAFNSRTRSDCTRKQRQYEINGETKKLKEWCAHYGIKQATVIGRMQKGASLFDALTMPLKKVGGKGRGRKPSLHTMNGESKTLTEWAKYLGINKATLDHRIWRGMTFIQAVAMGSKGRGQHLRKTGGGSELSPVD